MSTHPPAGGEQRLANVALVVGGRHRGTHPFPQPYARRHPQRRTPAITWPVLLLAVALTALITAVVVTSQCVGATS